MKKSSLFISVVLSTFVLVLLAGVLSAYRTFSRNTSVSSVQDAPVVQVADPATVTAQQAASAAAQYLNRSDLYSVETAALNGTTAFKVTFSSGDVVYVSTQGQVMSYIPAASVSSQSVQQLQTNPPASFNNEGNEHESGDHD
jgi:hypothetical protein